MITQTTLNKTKKKALKNELKKIRKIERKGFYRRCIMYANYTRHVTLKYMRCLIHFVIWTFIDLTMIILMIPVCLYDLFKGTKIGKHDKIKHIN
jgi:hypothetical protein